MLRTESPRWILHLRGEWTQDVETGSDLLSEGAPPAPFTQYHRPRRIGAPIRAAVRILIAAVVVVVVALALHTYGWPWEWTVFLSGGEYAGSRAPTTVVSTGSLAPYVERVAGKPWFVRYFTRLAFTDPPGPRKYSGTLMKWDRSRVRIQMLDDGGQGIRAYVRRLVRRLNRIQGRIHVALVDSPAEITVDYVSHLDFVRQVDGDGFVGFCRTSCDGSGALTSASILVDAGRLRSTDARKATTIHELTHALGFNGHLRGSHNKQRSVLYHASVVTMWSQPDAAAIRILYSPGMKKGLSVVEARRALRHFAGAR